MIHVGVTGHRILDELEKIDAGVETALRRIESAFPAEPMTVVSSLAEGADRIVARHVLTRPQATLFAVLPLARADYIQDFSSAESKEEFLSFLERAGTVKELPAAETRDLAYEAAGQYVLDHSDVVITIWDGQPSQGRGGTGDIINRARAQRMPIAWVHAGNREPETQHATSLPNEQGEVTFENL